MDGKAMKQRRTIQKNVSQVNRMEKEASINDKLTYNYLKSSWVNWVSTAETLVEVAYKLESERVSDDERFVDFSKADIYYMLIGFALENYLKAAIVQKLLISDRSIEEDRLDNVLKNHNISKLFSDAGLAVESKRYRSDLDYLSECIQWRGRYPVPTEAKHIDGSLTYHPSGKDVDLEFVEGYVYAITVDEIHEFVNMARKNLEYVVKKGKVETS